MLDFVTDHFTFDGPADALEWTGGRWDCEEVQRLPQAWNGPLTVKIKHKLSGSKNFVQAEKTLESKETQTLQNLISYPTDML